MLKNFFRLDIVCLDKNKWVYSIYRLYFSNNRYLTLLFFCDFLLIFMVICDHYFYLKNIFRQNKSTHHCNHRSLLSESKYEYY